VARAHVDQAADIAIGAHHAVHLILADQAQRVAVAQAEQFIGTLGKTLQLFGFVGQVAVTPGQVAGNGVTFDPFADDLHGFQAHQLHAAYAFLADHWKKLLQAVADAADQLAAIAPAGSPAELAGFQQDHREAALGQFDSRVQPRIAATDDTHICAVLTLQEGMVRVGRAAGGVIGSGVLRAVDHGRSPVAVLKVAE